MKSKVFIASLFGAAVLLASCSKENESFKEAEVEAQDVEKRESASSDDFYVFDEEDSGESFLAKSSTVDFNDIIAKSKKDAGAQNLRVRRIVYARGIQAYELQPSAEWAAKGPLADLYKASVDDVGDLSVDFSKTIGTHYQHLSTPAWEFPGGRVIAESASPIPGAGPKDVDWLNVVLERPNQFDYKRILRIATFRGKAPKRTNFRDFKRSGSGYETVYVFLK